MPKDTRLADTPPGGLPKRHRRKLLIFGVVGVLVIVGLGGYLLWQWWPKEDVTKNIEAKQQQAEAQGLKETQSSRQAIYDSQPYDDSIEQRYLSLQTKMATAEVGKDYAELEKFAHEVLTLPGHENDLSALIELDNAYTGLNDRTKRKENLQKIISVCEATNQKDSYAYQMAQKELAKL